MSIFEEYGVSNNATVKCTAKYRCFILYSCLGIGCINRGQVFYIILLHMQTV